MLRNFLAAAGFLSTGLVFAQPLMRLPFGDTVEAGQTVRVQFEGIPADVEEFELLLVAGSGEPFRLRVSRGLPRDTTSFLWTVPNLDVAQAIASGSSPAA